MKTELWNKTYSKLKNFSNLINLNEQNYNSTNILLNCLRQSLSVIYSLLIS